MLYGGDWNYLFYTMLGIIFFALRYSNKRNEKFFIQWDDKEMKYLLSKDKTIETIRFVDIKKITMQLYEIKIELPSAEKTISLENVQFKDLRKIKEKFEALKLDAEKKND